MPRRFAHGRRWAFGSGPRRGAAQHYRSGSSTERRIPAIVKLNRYAGEHGIPLVSSTDAHPEDALEFREWPPHCVTGTFGQQKPSSTLLTPRVTIPWNSTFDLSALD